ncbi:hypothetical protein AVEN_39137-1 [Araneus ventricosus]|uniref:Uncharacterized protein n=1 Tax=Araneus ventricosus TaxID=182803 RepID=A0A4Y2PJ87_ARAVE|nr:hypothetical protein AVEN_39137-1 [Araneus ventricosus]
MIMIFVFKSTHYYDEEEKMLKIIHHCSLSNCIFLGKPMKNKKNLQLQPQPQPQKYKRKKNKSRGKKRQDKTPEPTGPGGPQLEKHQPLAYPITKEFKK